MIQLFGHLARWISGANLTRSDPEAQLRIRSMAQAPTGRVYHMTWWFKAFAIFFLAFGVAIATETTSKVISGSEEPNYTQLALSLIFPAVGVGMTAKSFSSVVMFTESEIEQRSVFGSESISLETIRGRREYVVHTQRSGSTRYLRLVATDGSCLDFGKSLYSFDDVFWKWFQQLPDLDAQDQNREEDKRNSDHAESNFGLV
jgi:hypothetical protein